MMLSRWQPFNPMWNQLQQLDSEMNRVFDRSPGDGAYERGYAPSFPPINVWEDANSVHVETELPGFDLKDLEIYVTGGNQLTVKGERKHELPEGAVWHRLERATGRFVRVITLPFEIDRDHVDARFEHGVLHIKLAQLESVKPRRITVKAE